MGIASFTLEDNAYIHDLSFCTRAKLPSVLLRGMVVGDEVRDWNHAVTSTAIFPYDERFLPVVLEQYPTAYAFLWPYRNCLANSKMFGAQTKVQSGLQWYEYGRLTTNKLRTPLTITFAFVATHNHFILDRGEKVFNRSAPVIKLPEGASEDDHLGLLGLLNSSTACFWLKQIFHNKGSTVDQHGARQRTDAFEDFYEFTGTGLGQFPVVVERPLAIARTLDRLASERTVQLPTALLAKVVPTRAALDAAREQAEHLRRRMIAWQEELDRPGEITHSHYK